MDEKLIEELNYVTDEANRKIVRMANGDKLESKAVSTSSLESARLGFSI